jgi:rhomboid protease GluP
MVGTSACFGLVTSARRWRQGQAGWFFVHAALLVVLALGAWFDWAPIGYVAFFLWWLFSILPNYAERALVEALQRQRLSLAHRWASVATALHPFDGARERLALVASHYRLDIGDIAAAKGALYALLGKPAWSSVAKLELLSIDGRYQDIVEHAAAAPVGTRDLRLAPLYLRALGECGELDAMWKMYSEVPSAFARQPMLQLQMASYSGLTQEVEQLLLHRFSNTKSAHANLVRAVASMVAGDTASAERILRSQRELGGAAAVHAERRLAHPLRTLRLDELTSATQTRIADFRRDVAVMRNGQDAQIDTERRAWATVALIGIMVAIFLVGLPGGATDPENLVRLGALVLPSELTEDGILWRIVAAGFLHLGATHLLMNCLGLWVLGRQIEQLWSGFSMLAIFLASSIGSFTFAAAIVKATRDDPRIFLGASAGVMGLVGALGTYLAIGYIRHRRTALGQRFLVVVAIVAAQLVFDWFTPMVSSMLHMTGLMLGACAAIPLASRSWPSRHVRLG